MTLALFGGDSLFRTTSYYDVKTVKTYETIEHN